MRCLATIVQDGIDADELVDADPSKLIDGMTTLKQAMYATIDFLEKELRIKNRIFTISHYDRAHSEFDEAEAHGSAAPCATSVVLVLLIYSTL